MFHAHKVTRNPDKTVLIYQFENNMFHLQLGTRNDMFLFYTNVNVLFLPYSRKEHKNEEQSIVEERSFWKIRTANET